MNIPIRVTLFLFVIFFSVAGNAQEFTYPSKPQLKEHVNTKYRVSIGFPVHWSLDEPFRNEIWLSFGELRGNNAGCFVRVTEVEYLHLSTLEDYFAQIDEKAFVKLNSVSMPDLKVHLYDLVKLSGRKARRIVYSGTDSGIKAGAIAYQTLDGDRIFTVECTSESTAFQLLYNDFETIITSFRFRK